MENSSIKKINTAGKVGYVISILLIICALLAMVAIGICTVGAFMISDNEINVKVATNINITSTGNFLEKIKSFVFIGEIKDLSNLTEEVQEGIKLDDKDISELRIVEENGGLNIDAKTNEITISMKKIIIALISGFVFLGSVVYALYTVKALMKSLKKCETPFSEEVIKNMSKFAVALIVVVVLKVILGGFFSSFMTGTRYEFSLDLGSVLLVAVIYVLITVFKYGAKLQQESDETI